MPTELICFYRSDTALIWSAAGDDVVTDDGWNIYHTGSNGIRCVILFPFVPQTFQTRGILEFPFSADSRMELRSSAVNDSCKVLMQQNFFETVLNVILCEASWRKVYHSTNELHLSPRALD